MIGGGARSSDIAGGEDMAGHQKTKEGTWPGVTLAHPASALSRGHEALP
jgi:hypothetical protein